MTRNASHRVRQAATNRPLERIGHLPIGRFLREYWQRRPLLVRGALPGFVPPVDRARMFALAARDDVESRLVERRVAAWSLRHGPFPRRALPPLSRPRWTLLVQGLDLVDERAAALLARFRFLPDARLDDLMASYATDGGGVGPHVDRYDVFLLQTHGRRRWRISGQRGLPLQPRQPLRLLEGFRARREWVLEPGDLLYLPPGVPHDGVAEGECITCSIGFRAPVWAELLDPWFAEFADGAAVPGAYADPGARPTRHPARLPPRLVDLTHRALSRQRPRRAHTERFLLQHLSEPKAHVVFDRPRRAPSLAAFGRSAARRGVVLDPRSRLLLSGGTVAVNGECAAAPARSRPLLLALGDDRCLPPAAIAAAPATVLALLHDWLRAGWLHLAPARHGKATP